MLDWLIEQQARRGMTDLAFSRLLGVWPSTWGRMKKQQIKPGNLRLEVVCRAVRELDRFDDFVEALRRECAL